MNEIVRFENISKIFPGVKALQDVSFSINQGEIHAIVGENGAGKSTLMNILSGIYLQDEGEVYYKGKKTMIGHASKAIAMGICTVYQELKLCLNLTAVENIYLGRLIKRKFGMNNWKVMRKQTNQFVDEFGIHFDTNTPIRNLNTAQMQIVEIIKAISKNVELLILDEPTSSLTASETDKLFKLLRSLKEKGVTILFISHRLDEVFSLTDRITVLRDGRYLGTFNTHDMTNNDVVKLIAGDKLFEEIIKSKMDSHDINYNKIALEVTNLSRGKCLNNINFRLYEGEILGIYGLQGAGRTELMETLFGLHKKYRGDIFIHGKKQKIVKPRDAIKRSISFVTEDRKNYGLFGKFNVKENIAIIHRNKISKFGVLQSRKIIHLAKQYVESLNIKVSSLNQNILKLSGGNQQKVLISRALSIEPKIMLFDEPTRGIDVGAKAEIFKILKALKKQEQKSIIVISSELKEIVSECDRIIVMRNGRIVGELTEMENREEKVLNFAFNG